MADRPDDRLPNELRVDGHGWDERDFHRRFLPYLQQMMLDRSWITNSYAQLEYLFGDLIVKCRAIPEYQDEVKGPVPFSLDNRLRRLRKLVLYGPLAAHEPTLTPIFDELRALENTRHMFTHGFSSLFIQADGTQMALHLRRFVPPLKGQLETREELLMGPDALAAEREKWSNFTANAVVAFQAIYAALGLEANDVTQGYPKVLGRD